MRDRRGPARRGEQARVAARVRALLAEAEQPAGASAGEGGDGSGVRLATPWLPGDDFLAPGSPADSAERGGEVSRTTRGSPVPVVPPAAFGSGPASAGGLIARFAGRWPARIDPGRRGAIAVGVAVLVAAVVTGVWVFSSRPHALAITGSEPDPVASADGPAAVTSAPSTIRPSAVPTSGQATSAPPTLVVDVAGKVRHPGLYHLPGGSRVDDAVRAAGGALPGVDLTLLNLAAKVTDGQQIAVGAAGAASGGAAPSAGPSGSAATSAPVDLNTATLEELETLPGVGPVLAQHILDWRTAHGRFDTIDQLREVSGIGDVKFGAMRGLVSV